MHAIILLLATSGLRISEALHLTLEDVDLDDGVLSIHQSKFRKSRLVPLSPGTVAALRRYHGARVAVAPAGSSAAFFISGRGKAYSTDCVQGMFRTIATQTGLRGPKGRGPRLHDLRATFAVTRLLEWYRDGGNVMARLPLLSAYLGHASVMSTQSLPTLLRGFFEDYLAAQRDVSPNTIFAYRDSIKLFLRFAARQSGRQVIRLRLTDLGPTTVLSFLDHLEVERRNCVATRNCRLVAVHRFFGYVAEIDPRHAELCRRVVDIPVKKTASSAMTYLDRNEVKALLAAPSLVHRLARRDLALLTLLYNTGARASETVALNVKDVRFEPPTQVHISGKGRKERACPLWQETIDALRAYLQQRNNGNQPEAPLFLNAHRKRLSRFGVLTILKRHVAAGAMQQPSLATKRISPHTMRHTAAMHLLQSGVELNVIKSWLGHVSITTTSQYIEIDMQMKREAIERCAPPVPVPAGASPWRRRKDIIQWLEDL
jgi:site-specific recombinase XerD